MRGKDDDALTAFNKSRITPAYAGKRLGCKAAEFFMRDHPRLCGEKSMLEFKSPKMSGSPPPMRGKVFYGFAVRNGFGITPAYAGKRIAQNKSF